MKWNPSRLLAPASLICLGAIVSGCGTSEYERRLETQGLAAAQSGAKLAVFNQLYAPSPVAAGQAPTIRLPQAATAQFTANVPDDQFNNQPIAASELMPPNMTLPAFKVTWRGYRTLEGTNVNRPIYIYLCQQPAGASPSLIDATNSQVTKAFPSAALDWQDIGFLAEDGVTTVPFKKLEITGDMEVGVPTGGSESVPGTLQFYVHNSNGWETMIGFRTTDDLEAQMKFLAELAPAVCGSLNTGPAAAPQ